MAQEARNKLRRMGGIMASSPELMQAAQLPQADSVTVPGVGAPVVGLGRVQPMQPPRPVAGGIPALAAEVPAQRYAAGINLDPYAPSPSSYLMGAGEEPDVTVDDLVKSSVSGSSSSRLRSRGGSPEYSAEDVAAVSPGRARSGVPEPTLEDAQNLENRAEELRESGNPRSEATARRLLREAEEIRNRKATEESQASRDEYFQQGGPSGLSALATPIQSSMDDPETVERMQTQLRKVVEENQETTDDTDTDTPDGPPPPPEPTKKDLRSRYKEILGLYKDVLGEEDDDKALGFIMDLAVGFLTGQSPSFATNLATGAAGALQGMSERERARREREQGLRTLALESAIGEMDAEREAEARAAESRLDFERDVILEGIKARGGGGKNAYENVPRVAEQALTFENQLRERAASGGLTIPEGADQEAVILNEKNKQMLDYINTLGIEGVIKDPKTRSSLGQQYMYREVDPNDPEAGRLPLVRSDRELSFILPGQSYLQLDPGTGKYIRETKPLKQ